MESDEPTNINGLWDVIVMMVLLVCVVIGLCLWGLWIVFCSNMTSRSGRKKNKGNGKSLEEHNETDHMIGQNDTDCLEVKLEIKDEPAKETATRNVSDALKCKQFSACDVKEAAQDIQELRRHQSSKPKKYVGKLKYKLEYDFTRKTLNVTVIQCSDLLDFNRSSDPYVKLYLMPEVEAKFRTLVHHKTQNKIFDNFRYFFFISRPTFLLLSWF